MKKSFLITLLLALTLAFTFTSCDKEKVITSSELPQEITNYIAKHFPNHTILQVVIDRDDLTKNYEVILSENISLEFNRQYEIIEIDGVAQLPDSVIPAKILEYVSTNYPSNFITDWEIEDNHQQVELNNGLELEFNMQGDFLRIDN